MISTPENEPQGEPQPEQPTEKYFPMAMLEKISGGMPPIELEKMFEIGGHFRRENVLFRVESINNKKGTVNLKVAGIFGAVERVE